MSTLTPGPTRLETWIWSTFHKNWHEIDRIVFAVVPESRVEICTITYPPLPLRKMCWGIQVSSAQLSIVYMSISSISICQHWNHIRLSILKPTYVLLVRSPYSRTRSLLHLHPLCHERPTQIKAIVLVLNSHLSNCKGLIGWPSYCRLPHGMGEIHHSLRRRRERQTTNLPSWQRNMANIKSDFQPTWREKSHNGEFN